LLLLAGLALGLGAWTKNEGILYLVSVALAHGLVTAPRRGLRATAGEVAYLVAGAAPLLAILAHHRAIVPAGWFLEQQTPGTFATRVVDLARYRVIGTNVLPLVADLGGWAVSVLAILALCALAWGVRVAPSSRVDAERAALALGLALLGLLGAYVASPLDLTWQIPTSLPRLLIQLWPSAVVLFVLVVRAPSVSGDAPLSVPAAG
jgi:hypothetical protein